MYRPPKLTCFYDILDKQLLSVSDKRKKIFFVGDPNPDVAPKGNNCILGKRLISVWKKHGLSNVIKEFTRVTDTSRSIIDLSVASLKSKVIKAGTKADHRLNYSVLKLFRKREKPKLQYVTDWTNGDVKEFKDALAMVCWHLCNVFDEGDDNYWLAESLYRDISER